MKNVKYILGGFAVLLVAACSKEIPREVTINAAQLEIQGKTAHVVHADTAGIVIVRDSLPDEQSGLYHVSTSVTLVLDSIYSTDQMLDTPEFKLQSADGELLGTLQQADSLTTDSLIAFLGKTAGGSYVVNFSGQMDGKSILKLQESGKLSFTGFSFLFADPKIVKKLDEYRQHLDVLSELVKEAQKNTSDNPFSGIVYAIALSQVIEKTEALDKQLLKLKDQMTPLQRLRYDAYHKEMKKYDTK